MTEDTVLAFPLPDTLFHSIRLFVFNLRNEGTPASATRLFGVVCPAAIHRDTSCRRFYHASDRGDMRRVGETKMNPQRATIEVRVAATVREYPSHAALP